MADYPYLPLVVGDFIRDTQHLDARETGAYLLLIFAAWTSPSCAVPADDKSLARIARCRPREWLAVRSSVMAFWTLESDNLYHQKRLSKIKSEVTLKSIKAIQSAQARWLKNNETRHAVALRSDMPTHSERNANHIQDSEYDSSSSEISTDAARGAALRNGSAPRAKRVSVNERVAALAVQWRARST